MSASSSTAPERFHLRAGPLTVIVSGHTTSSGLTVHPASQGRRAHRYDDTRYSISRKPHLQSLTGAWRKFVNDFSK
jgi:hypothetical protein